MNEKTKAIMFLLFLFFALFANMTKERNGDNEEN